MHISSISPDFPKGIGDIGDPQIEIHIIEVEVLEKICLGFFRHGVD